jgi:hypothetical protein
MQHNFVACPFSGRIFFIIFPVILKTNVMKKSIAIILFLAFSFGLYSQEELGYNESSASTEYSGLMQTDYEYHNIAFNINLLGLLQFGPMFQLEARLGNGLYFFPHFRYGYLGALTHLDWGSFEDGTELSPLNLGVGVGLRYFIPVGETGNALYLGGLAEFAIGSAKNDLDEADPLKEEYQGINLFSNFGYRWRYSSGLFLNVGLYAGFAINYKDEERYIDTGELYDEYSGLYFGGGLEVSFGWEF